MTGKVFLIPTVLHSDEKALKTISPYVLENIKKCTCFYVENERTARRFLKKIWKEIVIDNYFWMPIQKIEAEAISSFTHHIRAGKNIAILSEAGCPGVADPGQLLIAEAQKLQARVIPFVGPNSILLALMASGMNGQHFEFAGYLPIEQNARKNAIREMENKSAAENKTFIFIETPYRNNSMVREILQTCKPETLFCIAVDITSSEEMIITKSIQKWRNTVPDIHKRAAIFLLYVNKKN